MGPGLQSVNQGFSGGSSKGPYEGPNVTTLRYKFQGSCWVCGSGASARARKEPQKHGEARVAGLGSGAGELIASRSACGGRSTGPSPQAV